MSESLSSLPVGISNGLSQATVQRVCLAQADAQPGMPSGPQFDSQTRLDMLAEEVPVALVYNGIAHAVMMCSPLDLEDFVRGFSLSERIVEQVAEIYEIEILWQAPEPGAAGEVALPAVQAQITIASRAFMQLKEKRRSMVGRTGCGICGSESLAALDLSLPPVTGEVQIALGTVLQAQHALRAAQVLNAATGSLHAAAWLSTGGEVLLLREDVGRHNALDKLIGALAAQKMPRADGFCLLTSRASYELVQKAARADMAFLATVSAPSKLAVQMAGQAGMTLLGFVRERGAVIYTHGRRCLL